MTRWTRREILAAGVATLVGCASPRGSSGGDGADVHVAEVATPTPDPCSATSAAVEGPYYLEGAPDRSDLDLYGDPGTPLTLSGVVLEEDCETAVAGAVVEFWQADPDGGYDNESSEMRYRGRVTTGEDGSFALLTLLPGRYATSSRIRPRHIHVRVFDGPGEAATERLTTQLFFEGDPYLDGDKHVKPNLVLPFVGSVTTEMVASDVRLVLT